MSRVIWIFCAALVLTEAALAAPWRAGPGLMDADLERKLRSRHPDIASAHDLENLLRDLGRRLPLRWLKANYRDGHWVVEGDIAQVIADISFEGVTRYLRNSLYSLTRNYVGQVDSLEVRRKLRSTVTSYMRKRGFPKAIVELKIDDDGKNASYQFVIEQGEPCIIAGIEYGFRLPKDVSPKLVVGEICDIEEINAAVNSLEEDLRNLGFGQVRVDTAAERYNRANNTTTLYISGVIGQKVKYQVLDDQKRFLIDDIFDDGDLTDIDPTIVGPDAMGVELARRYRNQGYIDVTVTGPTIDRASEDEVVYTYNVEPGQQYLLSNLQFEGVTVFERDDLPTIMDLDSIWQTRQPLNLDELKKGIDLLKAKYQEAGYWDVAIRDPGTGSKDRDTGTVRITIVVQEGKGRILKDVIIQGHQALSQEDILDLSEVSPGDPLDRMKLVDFQQALRTEYINRGYLYATVSLDLVPYAGKRTIPVEVKVNIDEGKRVRIGDITVSGLIRTKEKVVRRELLFEQGDWYDPERLAATRSRLTQLGLFQSVQILPVYRNSITEQAEELDLVVEVREASAGNVSFGPGWSSYSGFRYTAESGYANIGGEGRQITVRGGFSEEQQQAAIGPRTLVGRNLGVAYLEPYIFEWPVDGSIGVSNNARANEDFWELSYAGEVALIHKLRNFLVGSTISTFYGQKITREEGAPEKEDELISGNVRVGRVGLRYNIDRRDSLRFPTSGFTFDAETAWARYWLGGDLRYFRWEFRNNYYFGLFQDLVFAIGLEVTSYENVERASAANTQNILPPSERLFSGGRDSVRGYAPRELGPIVRSPVFKIDEGTDEPGWDCTYRSSKLGGSKRTLLQMELRYRLLENIALASFVDSGNTFFSQGEMREFAAAYADSLDPGLQQATDPCFGINPARSVEDNVGYTYAELLQKPGYFFSRHYLSYGLSVNWLTPIGSVNIAYGLPWREPKTERCNNNSDLCFPRTDKNKWWFWRGELHINVGTRF